MLKLPNNEPEAEEADGDVNETYDEIDDYWRGGDDNKGEGDIENKYSEDAAHPPPPRGCCMPFLTRESVCTRRLR